MDVRLLGPLEVVDGHGAVVAIGTGRQRALLELRAHEPVVGERLVDELWGESPPATAPRCCTGARRCTNALRGGVA